jgi:chlorobactene glucosyltransferase
VLTVLLVSLLFFLGILVINSIFVGRLNHFAHHTRSPLISILIPARNEEERLPACLEALSQQTYLNREILVYDDNSEDNTAQVVLTYASRAPSIYLIKGAELPAGWLGKPHACHRLSQEARGEILLFLDADVLCNVETLTQVIGAFEKTSAGAISVFPRQLCSSPGEHLTVPFMDLFLYCLLPLPLTSLVSTPSMSAATGQFFAVKRDVYQTAGGHLAVRGQVLEDLHLCRLIKQHHGSFLTLSGSSSISCRMYRSWHDARDGFTKNLFSFFSYRSLPLFLFLLAFFTLTVFPFFLLLLIPSSPLVLVCALTVLVIRLIHAIRFHYSLSWAFWAHLLGAGAVLYIGLRSWYSYQTGVAVWKGRVIDPDLPS